MTCGDCVSRLIEFENSLGEGVNAALTVNINDPTTITHLALEWKFDFILHYIQYLAY